MEFELAAGDRELLEAADARLRAAGARPAPTATKLERALAARLRAVRQAAGDPAGAGAGSARLTPGTPAGDVVLAYVRWQARAITRYDPLVRRGPPAPVPPERAPPPPARGAPPADR